MKQIIFSIIILMASLISSQAQIITTFAGNGSGTVPSTGNGGPATAASMPNVQSVYVDDTGNTYIIDVASSGILELRKISALGVINALYVGVTPYIAGSSFVATGCYGLVVDDSGNVYTCSWAVSAPSYYYQILRWNGTTGWTVYAGTTLPGGGYFDGYRTTARFKQPHGLALDASGNVYIADGGNNVIRKIDHITGMVITVAGNNSLGAGFSGDSGPATAAQLSNPYGVAVNGSTGDIYIADYYNSKIRKVTASTGKISSVANTSGSQYVTMGTSGEVYFSDSVNNLVIKKLSGTTLIIIAGTGIGGYSGDNGPATAAKIYVQGQMAVDPGGELYFPDASNNRIREICTNVVTPVVAIIPSATSVCAGTSVSFSLGASYSGSSPTVQWKVNGTNVSTATTYSYVPNNGDIVTCIMVSSAVCASTATVTSTPITMTVTSIPTSDIFISAPSLAVCTGTSAVFTSTITNGGTSPIYQWKVNGTNVGTGTGYTYTPVNGDVVKCTLVSNAACVITPTVTSASLTMTVSATVLPTITISPSATPICAGASVNFTSLITNGGTSPTYQWTVNSANVGTSSTYSYVPTGGDIIKCTLVSNSACATTPTVTSTPITVTVTPTVTPTISISTSAASVCAGTSAVFTSTVTNGGASPTYQWKVNITNVGTGTTYGYVPTNGDIIKCTLISNAACATTPTVTSTPITMVVTPTVTPTISITPSATSVCAGEMVNFTSSITNGGISPSYQWKVNTTNAGTATTYGYIPANGDVVKCILISNATCATTPTVTSTAVTMTVIPLPTIYTVSGAGTYTSPTNVTLSSSQSGVNYQLYDVSTSVGGVVAGTGSGLSFPVTMSGTYFVVATNGVTGCIDTMSGNAVVTINTTGVSEVNKEGQVAIFPNPAKDKIEISGIMIEKIQIFDMTGGLLIDETLHSNKITVDISKLMPGVYFVNVNERSVQKIVK